MEATTVKKGKVGRAEVDTGFLGDVVKVRLLRQAVRMYEANMRAGTHSTKRRGELPYRKAPLFRQKGTGRARVRHAQATQCRHGGVPHGPKPRDYSYSIPQRAKHEALRSALLSKFRDEEICLIDGFGFDAPRTKNMVELLAKVGFDGGCLVVAHEFDPNLLLSARNLRKVEVVPVEEVNAYHLLKHRNVIMTEDALQKIRERTSHEA